MIDRFAAAGEHKDTGVLWRPTQPAALPDSYLREVDDYLRRVDAGEPTGRARLEQLHPNPPCHTRGGNATHCPVCHNAGWSLPPSLGRPWWSGPGTARQPTPGGTP